MSDQYLPFYEETTRGTKPGAPTRRFYPVIKGLNPKFSPKDEPRKEFRGQDTGLGDATVTRKESIYTFAPEMRIYPGVEIGLFMKHLLGYAGARSVVDTSAYRGLLYPVTMPYGTGASLADKAIGLEPCIDRDGVTASQTYGGWRPKSATISIKPPEDVTISFDGQGPGPFVGAANQAAVAGATFPVALPFSFADVKYYIGGGATRTGTAPDYTNIQPGSMIQFKPDDCTIKITNGLEDAYQGDGVRGPTKSERKSQFGVEVELTMDFRDPGSGFSSIDEFEAIYSGPRTNSLMIVMDSGQLAGNATETYKWILDIPLVKVDCDSPDPDNEGKQVKAKFKMTSLVEPTVKKPLYIMTTDKASAY